MRKIATRLGVAATAALTTVTLAGAPATAATTWTINPTCSTVTGPGTITYTKNDGQTLRATTGTPTPITYNFGLAALDTANTLISVQTVTTTNPWAETRTVYRSTNAGCTWTSIGTLPDGGNYNAVAAKGGRAYLYSLSGPDAVYRVTGTTITKVTDPTVADAPANGVTGFVGLTAYPSNGLHLLGARSDGQLFESFDGGATWARRGVKLGLNHHGQDTWVFQVAFNPTNPLHAVAATSSEGVSYTFDGGLTWTKAAGFDETSHPNSEYGVNVFTVEFSPANPNVVYLESLDVSQISSDGDGGRQIRRSLDGGLTYSVIVHHEPGVVDLVNGTPLFPSPANKDLLYFSFGSSFANYGTDLFKFNAATGTLTKTHSNFHRLDALAFNPLNPSTLYLGFGVEPGYTP